MKKGILIFVSLMLLGSSAYSMDNFEKVMLRDTLIGAGAGLVIGLLANNTGTWVLVGSISGAIFGYIDAEEGIWTYQNKQMQFKGLPTVHATLKQTPRGKQIAYRTTLFSAKF